jgi:hypothetical protein
MESRQRAALSIALILSISAVARAQTAAGTGADSRKRALIHELLRLTRAVDLAVTSMEAAVPAQKAANPRIPAVFWERFLAQARTRRSELETMIVAVYDRHLSSDELRQIITFYRTPVGQKLIAELSSIAQESMQAGQTWGEQIGASVAAQLAKEGTPLRPPF